MFIFEEGIAKLASRAKFSDFFIGSIFCKVTYLVGHRHFAKNRIQWKKRKFGYEWSFAIPSEVKTKGILKDGSPLMEFEAKPQDALNKLLIF